RARLMQACPPGAMLAVPLAAPAIAARLPPDCTIALVNGPALHVLAGPQPALAALRAELAAGGVAARWLSTSHAFHAPQMDGAVAPFAAQVAQVARQAPQIPFVSNVSGTWISAAAAQDPAYWGRQLRAPVQAAAAFDQLVAQPERVLLAVGPDTTLATLARRQPASRSTQVVLATFGQRSAERSEEQ